MLNSRQRRKQEAKWHNQSKIDARIERARIEQDKIDNPEKYARRDRRALKKVMPFIALAAAAGVQI